MNKLLLIDGSSLLNSQYFGNIPVSLKVAKDLRKKAKTEEEINKANEAIKNAYKNLLQTKDGIYTNAVYGFLKYMFAAIKVMNPEYIAITWDVTRNTFRRDLMPSYKGNRGEVEDPLKQQFKTCQEVLRKMGIPQYFSEEYESDDFCGSLVKKFEKEAEIYILTKDHDFFQLISEKTNILLLCQTLKIANDLNKKHSINEKEIPSKTFLVNEKTLLNEYNLKPNTVTFVKGLAGDSADNIPGIPNIGDVTAVSLSKLYDSVSKLFEDIESKTEDELKDLLLEWKKVGVKRNPLKYLTAKNVFKNEETNLSAKEIGILSQTLATIKTDINLDVKLENLKFLYDKEKFKNILKEYEIISIKL